MYMGSWRAVMGNLVLLDVAISCMLGSLISGLDEERLEDVESDV